jgi:hypothetical protein
MKRWIRRARRARAAEIWCRSVEGARIAGEALRVAAARARWDRRRLGSILQPSSFALREARQAAGRGDWPRAESALRSHLLDRPRRFAIAPGDRTRLAALVRERHPDAVVEAVSRAIDLRNGHYHLLGYRALDFRGASSDVDWHFDPVSGRRAPVTFWARVPYLDPRSGDHKIIWELNRHQHWLALGRAAWLTGDGSFAVPFRRELESWLRANPPLVGINWSSMLELAFRAISWIWALHLFAEFDAGSGEPVFVDLLVALDRQLDHIANHLSTYFSPNTHLLGEGLALYIAGRSLPELASSARWEEAGRRILMREARAQILPDGGHAELSTHYHRYALDFYLLALVVARRTEDSAAGAFEEVAARLAEFCRAIADDHGRLPTIGDDDGGLLFPMCGRAPSDVSDSLALAAALMERPRLAVGDAPEEAIWMLAGEVPPPIAPRSRGQEAARLFPDAGVAVLRTPEAHAVVDVGRHGFMNGGHAHADALSLVLSAGGHSLLVDPGTHTYTMDAESRDRFRSTAMHNTVVIDGRSQSRPAGPFHWAARPARARVDAWRPDSGFIEGSHDGYLPLVHRRGVLRAPGGLWIVADHVLGTGRRDATAHWHLSPEWIVEDERPSSLIMRHVDGARAAFATTAPRRDHVRGDDEGLGWYAPVYGRLEPASTLRFSQSGEAPFSIITAVAYGAPSAGLALHPASVVTAHAHAWHSSAALLESGERAALVLFATPLLAGAPERGQIVHWITTSHGVLSTDARVLFLQLCPAGEPVALVAIDCTRVEWEGAGAFRLAPRPEERDLHLEEGALRRLSRAAAARPVG